MLFYKYWKRSNYNIILCEGPLERVFEVFHDFVNDVSSWFNGMDQRTHLPDFEFSLVKLTFKHPFLRPSFPEQGDQFFSGCTILFGFLYLLVKAVFEQPDWRQFL